MEIKDFALLSIGFIGGWFIFSSLGRTTVKKAYGKAGERIYKW